MSFGSIGVPARRSTTLISVVAIHRVAIPGQDGIEAGAERVNQFNVTRRGLRAGDAEAHFRLGNGRDHDTVAAQYRLLQVLQQRFGLLAHDERADTVRISFFELCVRAPGRPDGTQDDAFPFPDDLQLAHPLKILIPGQTDGTMLPFLKIDTVLIIFYLEVFARKVSKACKTYRPVKDDCQPLLNSICIVYAGGKYMRMPYLCRWQAYGYA